MKRFATALAANRIIPVSEVKDPKERDLLEKLGRSSDIVTSVVSMITFAATAEEANQVAITQSNQYPVKAGWYNLIASSVEIV